MSEMTYDHPISVQGAITASPSKPPVHEAQDRLEIEVDELSGALARLFDQLKPILTPENDGVEKGLMGQPEAPRSEIAGRTHYQCDRIATLRSKINELNSRVEV